MAAGSRIDFGRIAEDYARWRPGFPDSLFERLLALDVGRPGQKVLDLSSGTGTLARALARRGCEVTAIERSEALLAEAARIDASARIPVRYFHAPAEQTGLSAEAFEAVVAGQCWHWVDRPAASAEARRVLVRGGRLAIAQFDWLALPGNVGETTWRLITLYSPKGLLGDGTGLYGAWLRDLGLAGFTDLQSFSFDVPVTWSHEAWRGRIRASAAVGAVLDPEQLALFDRDLRRLLESKYKDPIDVLHRCFCIVARAG